jgi:hypothetical protein
MSIRDHSHEFATKYFQTCPAAIHHQKAKGDHLWMIARLEASM